MKKSDLMPFTKASAWLIFITDMNTQNQAVQLTELETKAMRVLFESAQGNGHDFGFIEDLIDARIMGREQVGGVVSSLVQKGVIFHWGTENNTNGFGAGSYTQFTWEQSRFGDEPYFDSLAELCEQGGITLA